MLIDFLIKLPIVWGKSTVLVIVDRFSKMLRLIFLGEQTDTESVACAFFDYMVHMHCLLWNIISYRNLKFLGQVWTGLMSTMGTKLLFLTAYHPQTDG